MKNNKIAIIDPVGLKAGMNCYDLGLLNALNQESIKAYAFSNFKDTSFQNVVQKKVFAFKKRSLPVMLLQYLYGTIYALVYCRMAGVKHVLFHIFSATHKEYVQLKLAKRLGLHIISIVHDIESLSKEDQQTLKHKIYNLSDHLIVHNNLSYKSLIAEISEDNKAKISIIPHGNYTDFVLPNECPEVAEGLGIHFQPGKKYLLFFGQIKPVKGLDILLKAMADLPEDFVLVIAGRPHRDDFGKYQSIITNLNLQNKVIPIIRFISDEERDFLFKKCDALVLPYRKIFQSGVLLMALSYGLPIVASDLDANKEIIMQNQNGCLFPDGNSKELAKQIVQLFEGDNLRRLQSAALETANTKFSWHVIAKKYLEILQGTALK